MHDDLKQQMVEELNELLESRESDIGEMYPKVREAYQTSYDWPELDTLRHEVSICLIFGLHQAAITLTNHMLESLLKFALSYKDSSNREGNTEDHSLAALIASIRPSFERYDGEQLNNTINMACKAELISEEQKEQLHEFRQALRNAYSHAEKRKIHQNKEIPVQSLHMTDEAKLEMDPEEVHKILDMPFLHGMAQYEHAKANALPYFLYVDKLTRDTMPKVFQGLNSPDKDGAS